MATKKDIERWAGQLSHKNYTVRERAARALSNNAEKGMDISVAISALSGALSSDEHPFVKIHSATALQLAAANGIAISIAVPALIEALWDERRVGLITKNHILSALCNATKTDADLEELKKALAKFVEKEEKGTPRRKIAERIAGEAYVEIANAVSQRRTSIGMDGVMLPDKIKPPKGPKMYRQRVAV